MKEDFLHYLWQYQYFDKRHLRTCDGQQLAIYHPGYPHSNSGPDFLQAKVQLGGMSWAGHVEIHLQASDWRRHGHHTDPAYNAVVLHVVWEADQPALRQDGSLIPVLELKGRVSPLLVERYASAIMHQHTELPCSHHEVEQLVKINALERALADRLWQKTMGTLELWKELGQDWEQTAYWLVARAFGFQINTEGFVQLAKAMPLHLFRKAGHSQEALAWGQSGLLPAVAADAYTADLQRQYAKLQKAFELPDAVSASAWKRLRMRPSNFPERRIAGFIGWLQHHSEIAMALWNACAPPHRWQLLDAPLPSYWQQHADFGKPLAQAHATLGDAVSQHLLINAALPLSWAKAATIGQEAASWTVLQHLPAEDNKIVRLMKAQGFPMAHAADSQGALALFGQSCQKRLCLRCPVGIRLMRTATSSPH